MPKKINKKLLREIAADSRYKIFENWNRYLNAAATKNTTTLIEQQEEMPRRFAGMSTKYLTKKGYEWRNGSMVHKTKGDIRDVMAIYKARRAGASPPARKYGSPGSHFAGTQPGAAASTATPAAQATSQAPKRSTSMISDDASARLAGEVYDALEGAGTDKDKLMAALDETGGTAENVYALYRAFTQELQRRNDTGRGDLIKWLQDDGEDGLARKVHKKASAGYFKVTGSTAEHPDLGARST